MEETHPAEIHLLTPPGHRHVKAVVAADFGIRPAPPGLEGLDQRAAFLRNGKIDDHGGAPCQGGLEAQEGVSR